MKSYWISLACKDLSKSIEFYRNIGLTVDSFEGNPSAYVRIGSNVLGLFDSKAFQDLLGLEKIDYQSNNVLISADLSTKEEVDKLEKLVVENGGKILKAPGEMNGLYGMVFRDLDDHLVNVIVM